MKKTLVFILDWIVMLVTIPSILILLNIDNFSTSWKIPIFLNAIALLIMIYVQFVHEDKSKRFNSIKQYADFLLWINIIAFISQLSIGLYKKYNFVEPVIKPLWQIDLIDSLRISFVYFIIIFFLFLLSKKK